MLFKGKFGELFHESGLTKKQAGQTFESFEKISKETAMACVLAKKAAVEHENIILAGRAGVGKTHLAVSTAIHVMREGKLKRVYSISNNYEEYPQ